MADETTRVEVGSDVPTRAQAPAAATSSPPADELPARVDRFVVLARLGSGGMGVVYGAYDPSLDRKVAVKLVRADVFGSTHSGEGRARLLREAQAMAQLSHPNVVAVHEVGEHAGAVFLAMEYVQGQTVRTWLKEQHQADPRRRRWRELVGVFLQAGEGLSAAHRAGLVHRDFKPKTRCPSQTAPLPPFGRILARRGDPRGAQRRVVPRHAAALATEWQRAARQRATPRFCLGA